jgi:hypothetical protein
MISSELLGMFLVLIGVLLLCGLGYIIAYTEYVLRFKPKYGKEVFKRGLRYLKRL